MAITAAQLQVIVEAETKGAEVGLRRVNEEIERVGASGRLLDGLTGAVRGLVAGLGQLGLAAMGMKAISDAAFGLGRALLSGNVAIENVTAQLMAFTKDAGKAQEILATIRTEAAKTPFAFQEMAQAVTMLLPASQQANVDLMELVRTAEVLAALNPAEGLTGAAFALREALSGDFVSIVERFNLPRQYLNQLKEQGVPAIEAVRMALHEMGADSSLVSNLAGTLTGRWSTFTDILRQLRDTATQPIFQMLSDGLAKLTSWLEQNQPRLEAFAATVGQRLAQGLGIARDAVITFVQALQGQWQDDEQILPIHRVFGRIGTFIREQVIPNVLAAFNELKAQLSAFWTGFTTGETGGFAQNLGVGLRNVVNLVQNEILPRLREFANWFSTEAVPKIQEFAARVQPILDRVFGFISQNLPTIIPLLTGFLATFSGLSAAVGPLTSLIGPLSTVFSLLRAGVSIAPMLTTLVSILGGPVTLAIAGIAAAVVGLYVAWQTNFLGIRDIVAQVWGFVQPIIQAIIQHFQRFATEVAPLAAGAWQNIVTAVSTVLNFLWNIVSTVFGAILSFLQAHAAQIRGILEGAWNQIVGVVQIAVSIIEGIIKIVLAVIAGEWGAAWNALKEMLSGVWDGIKLIVSGALEILKNVIALALDGIKAIWERIWTAIRDAAGRLIEEAKQKIQGGIDAIKGLFAGAADWLVEAGKDIVRGLVNGISSMIEWAKNKARELASSVKDAVMGVLGIRSPSTVMQEIGENVVEGLILGLLSKVEDLENAVHRLAAIIERGFREISTTAVQELAEAVKAIADQFAQLDVNVSEETVQKVEALAEITGAVGKLAEIARELSQYDPADLEVASQLIEYLPRLATQITEEFLAAAANLQEQEVIGKAQELANAYKGAIEAISEVAEFAAQFADVDPESLLVPAQIIDYLPQLAATLTEKLATAAAALDPAQVTPQAEAVKGALGALIDTVEFIDKMREIPIFTPEYLDMMGSRIVDFAVVMAQKVQTAFASIDEKTIIAKAQALETVAKSLAAVVGVLKTGLDIGVQNKQGAPRGVQMLVEMVKQVVDAIVYLLDKIPLETAEKASQLIEKLEPVIRVIRELAELIYGLGEEEKSLHGNFAQMVREVLDVIAQFMIQIIRAMSDVIAEALGKIFAGIIATIQGIGDQIIKEIQGIATSIQQAIAGGLQIQSPSRVMYRLGEQAGLGFVLGFDSALQALPQVAAAGVAATNQYLSASMPNAQAWAGRAMVAGAGPVTFEATIEIDGEVLGRGAVHGLSNYSRLALRLGG